jgi:peroxiredoxin
MRAVNGAFLAGSAVLLAVTMGCASADSQPQAFKTSPNADRQNSVQRSIAAVPSVEPSPDKSGKDVKQAADSDGSGQLPAVAPIDGATSKPNPQRITALKPPTIRPAVMPEVVLSAAHSGDSFVGVGDQFPDFRLPDLAGRAQALPQVQGDGLTVIVIWASDRLATENQLRYLNEHIVRYADVGVRSVAIHTGQMPDQVREAVDAIELSVPVLLDSDGRLFARIGRNHLPRTYLLDRDGRVLWFDIEFSRHTRENLEQAIHASLNST